MGTNIEFNMANSLGLSTPIRLLEEVAAPTTVDDLLKINFDFTVDLQDK